METGLHFYRARYYASTSGRFLSEDLLGFAAESNFYRYVANNVMNFSDPSGLVPRLGPEDTARRPCTPGEHARCAETCGSKGVEHCYVAMHRTVVGLRKGKARWDWVDGPLDCSCNDPDDPICVKEREKEREPEPRWFPIPAPNWNRVAVGAVVTVAITAVVVVAVTCPECPVLLPALAP